MPSVAVDSSVLYALFDQADKGHSRASAFLTRASQKLIANLPVLTEVVYLLDFSQVSQRAFLNFAQEALTIDQQTATDLPRIVEIMAKYADLPADFADASLVALCERQRITQIATFDKDFDIYRLADGKQLANVMEMR